MNSFLNGVTVCTLLFGAAAPAHAQRTGGSSVSTAAAKPEAASSASSVHSKAQGSSGGSATDANTRAREASGRTWDGQRATVGGSPPQDAPNATWQGTDLTRFFGYTAPRLGLPTTANPPLAAQPLYSRIIISVPDSATHAQVDSMNRAREARNRATAASSAWP